MPPPDFLSELGDGSDFITWHRLGFSAPLGPLIADDRLG
jgi:hypothetical protein